MSRGLWARDRGYTRYQCPWTQAEDHKLLRLGESNMHWHDVADKMKRSLIACQTRYYALKAGIKFALAAKR